MACTQRSFGGNMRVGSLVKSKWLNYNQLGIVTGNATPDEGWTHWCVQWIGDNCLLKHTLEYEEDLEVLCE